MTAKPPRFRFEGLAGDAPCPFRHGLYQLMRNRVLADALIEETDAGWADFAVCIHPGNHQARRLAEAIGGKTDAVEAFRAIAGADAVVELDPMAVVEAVRDHAISGGFSGVFQEA